MQQRATHVGDSLRRGICLDRARESAGHGIDEFAVDAVGRSDPERVDPPRLAVLVRRRDLGSAADAPDEGGLREVRPVLLTA